MIAITFSLPDESEKFRRSLQVSARAGTGVGSAIRGALDGVPVIVWHIGVGAERARREAARLLAEAKPEIVLCAGYGGALVPGMQLGEIVLDTRGTLLGGAFQARTGRIFTAAHLAETTEEKRRLGVESGALAVDMETALVADIFEPAGIPVLGIRAISDRLEDDVPVPMECLFDLERQRPRIWGLLGFLMRNPRRIVPFACFVRNLDPARGALEKTLAEMVSRLGQR